VAFDIGGVLSKYPTILRAMARALHAGGAEVFVLSDMQNWTRARETLDANGFDFIPDANLLLADFERYGEACKAVLLERLYIDVHLDDFPAYVLKGCPVRLLVQPDLESPYYDDSWQTDGAEGEFGRRQRVRRFTDH
jgi:hypothetical protein